MWRRRFVSVVLGLALGGCGDDGGEPAPADLAATLAPIRDAHGVPALGALVFDTRGTLGVGAVGVRKAGDATPVEAADAWHLGSDTKAMTATLVAQLVDDGALAWDTTLGAALPELAASMDPLARGVTLTELLTMRGGFHDDSPRYAALDLGDDFEAAPVRTQRARIAAGVLALAPDDAPGSAYTYSNLAYVIAGAVLEAHGDAAWEDLVRARLFAPLGMTGCGFGPPATPGTVDAPWGHTHDGDAPVPMALDNPAWLGPAGTVHCPLAAWARFGRLHLRGATNAPGAPPDMLSAAAFTTLHTPWQASYAMGWGVLPSGTARILTHDGSNTLNYARIVLVTEPPIGLLIVTNDGSAAHGQAAVDAATAALAERYGLTMPGE